MIKIFEAIKKKKILILFIILGCFVGILVCNLNNQRNNVNSSSVDNFNVPENMTTETLGYIEHGPNITNTDLNGQLLPYKYNGGEFKLGYNMSAGGIARNIGFLVFVDGKPQKFKISDDEKCEYYNSISLQDAKEKYEFSIIFTPPKGNKNEILDCSVVSLYNSEYKPDMKDNISYAINHSSMACNFPIQYNINKKKDNQVLSSEQILTNAKWVSEPIEESFLNKDLDMSIKELDNKNVYSVMYMNNEVVYDNLNLKRNKRIHITYKILGHPNSNYRTTFYIDHKPICDNEQMSYETHIEDGSVNVIELDLDVADIQEPVTFYAVSVPTNIEENKDANLDVIKTSSILLFRK